MSGTEQQKGESLQEYVTQLTEHQTAIRAYIASLLPGSSEVGDVVQNTNVVLWQKRGRFEKGGNFLAWAFAIARYEVKHHRDRLRRDGARLVFSDKLIDSLAADDRPDGDEEDYLRALDACYEKLSARQKELVDFRYTSGKSLEQYSRQTGASAVSLRSALLRVRKALKHCVKTTMAQGAA